MLATPPFSNINNLNFLDQFERLNSGNYLKMEESTTNTERCFSIVEKKTDKNLNKEEIYRHIENAFTSLLCNRASENLDTFKQQQVRVKKLKAALQTYHTRLKRSAPWYWKILAFFGFQSPLDKKMDQLFARVSKEAESQPLLLEKSRKAYQSYQTYLLSTRGHLVFFYHFVLGNTDLEIDKLNGSSSLNSQYHYLSLLQEFQATLTTDSPSYLAIQEVVEQLTFGAQISVIHKDNLPLNVFIEHFLSFLSDPTQKTFMIPGGTRKHCVLYEIEREENGDTFRFKLTDTGVIEAHAHLLQSKSNHFLVHALHHRLSMTTEKKHHLERSINELTNQYEAFSELKKNNKTQDLSYTGLTAAHFSVSFIETLFAFNRSSDSNDSMDSVIKFLDQHLAMPNKSNLTITGRVYTRQKKGTCAHKAFASWLHTRLGKELYSQFKVFYTTKQVESLESLFKERSTAVKAFLAQCTFSRIVKQTGNHTSAKVELDPSKRLLEILKKLRMTNNAYEKQLTYSWSPQEAKEAIRSLAHQVLRKRKQKLEQLLVTRQAG